VAQNSQQQRCGDVRGCIAWSYFSEKQKRGISRWNQHAYSCGVNKGTSLSEAALKINDTMNQSRLPLGQQCLVKEVEGVFTWQAELQLGTILCFIATSPGTPTVDHSTLLRAREQLLDGTRMAQLVQGCSYESNELVPNFNQTTEPCRLVICLKPVACQWINLRFSA